jgi:hypothetical protein
MELVHQQVEPLRRGPPAVELVMDSRVAMVAMPHALEVL